MIFKTYLGSNRSFSASSKLYAGSNQLFSVFLLLFALIFAGLQKGWTQSITKVLPASAVSVTAGDPDWTPQSGTLLSAIQNPDGVNVTSVLKNQKSEKLQVTGWGFTVGGSGGFPAGALLK
jgi:hypothetical protein